MRGSGVESGLSATNNRPVRSSLFRLSAMVTLKTGLSGVCAHPNQRVVITKAKKKKPHRFCVKCKFITFLILRLSQKNVESHHPLKTCQKIRAYPAAFVFCFPCHTRSNSH